MIFLYNIFIRLYKLGIRLASFKNKKAANWLQGRENIFTRIEKEVEEKEELVWIHASSAGEFEQAKPVIDALKIEYPAYKVLVTLFSPSGYQVAKKYANADYVFYLPLDTKKNANRLLNIFHPKLVIFIKYDFWYHHLKAIHTRYIPLLLVSSIFRENQVFFKWYGSFFRKMLRFFQRIFVQDEASLKRLEEYNIQHGSLGGDTRFDRVIKIAEKFTEVLHIKEFIGNKKVIIAGSTWPDDEILLKEGVKAIGYKLILAPHEIDKEHIEQLQRLFPSAILYSQFNSNNTVPDADVLIIDNIGTLSRLYYYATITYIGGGFTKSGIHNTLEAAVYGKPVIFGPNYYKFREAKGLIEKGGGFTFSNQEELQAILQELSTNEIAYKTACNASLQYVQAEQGATKRVLDYIQEKRLLTK